ncbi:MAG: hypothetical protein ACI89Z_000318 [Porticoccus sp.]|jgi:hypothetical protein
MIMGDPFGRYQWGDKDVIILDAVSFAKKRGWLKKRKLPKNVFSDRFMVIWS